MIDCLPISNNIFGLIRSRKVSDESPQPGKVGKKKKKCTIL